MADTKKVAGGLLGGCGCLGAMTVLCAGGAGAAWFFMGKMKGGDIDDVAKRLPSTTAGLVAFRGAADLAVEFRGVLDGTRDNPQVAELREESIRTLGFDITSPEEVANSGFDLTSPWAAAVGDMDSDQAMIFVPVTDEAKVQTTIERALASEGVTPTSQQAGSHTIWSVGSEAAYAFDDDYLVLSVADRGDQVAALTGFLAAPPATTLADSPDWKDAKAAAGDDWHFFAYGGSAAVLEAMGELDADARRMMQTGEWRSGIGTVHLDDQRITSRMAVLGDRVDEVSAVLPEVGKDGLGDKIGGEALGAMRISMNLDGLWTALEADPTMGSALKSTNAEMVRDWGVDLKADVFSNLDGHLTTVVMKGGGVAVPVDGAAWIGVKDAAKAKAVIEKVNTKLAAGGVTLQQDHEGGQDWYHMPQGGVGLVDDHLVVVFGEGRRQAIKAGAASSFKDGMPDHARKGLEKGSAVFGFVDIPRVATLGEGLGSLMGAMGQRGGVPGNAQLDAIKQLTSGWSFSAGVASGALMFESSVHAGDAGFSKAIAGGALDQLQ